QGRIADLVRARTLLLGAISHDLKTYITRLRIRVEQLPAEDQREKAARDLDDMTTLIDDALAVSRGTFVSGRRETVDLQELLTTLIGNYPADRVRFAKETGSARIKGEPVALRRMFANLIDNALRFGTICEIAILHQAGRIVVTIDDDGPGIPAVERNA